MMAIHEGSIKSLFRREVGWEGVLTALSGAVLGSWFLGPRNLSPRSLSWLDGDALLNQIAYEYFWRAPLIQFPLSATPDLGSGWHTGLHSNGENLPMALLFKPLASLVESGFQFQGIWVVICFALQAFIANRIFLELRLGLLSRTLGTLIVTLSPTFIHRIATMWHLQMAAHWVLLLALLFYIRRCRMSAWYPLLAYVAATNIYLLVMVCGIWFASLIDRFRVLPSLGILRSLRKLSGELFGAASIVVTVMAVSGYLTYVGVSTPVGAGLFRASPLTFANPSESNVFAQVRKLSSATGHQWVGADSEAFAYLGFGILALTPIAIVRLARFRGHTALRMLPLAVVLIALFVFALSNRVAVAGREFVVPVPHWMIDTRQILRSAPRFVWPLVYASTIGSWWLISSWASNTQRRTRVAALVIIFAVQMTDVVPYVLAQKPLVSDAKVQEEHLTSAQWSLLLRDYDSISIAPTFDYYEDHNDSTTEVQAWAESKQLLSIVQFGARHNIKLNFAYVSRPIGEIVARANDSVEMELTSGELKIGTIYLISTEELWNRYTRGRSLNSFVLDEIYVILGPPKGS